MSRDVAQVARQLRSRFFVQRLFSCTDGGASLVSAAFFPPILPPYLLLFRVVSPFVYAAAIHCKRQEV